MKLTKTLLASAAIALLIPATGHAAAARNAPVLLAQAATDVAPADAVLATAQAAVEAARAALRAAIASGQGVDEARATLREALQNLEQARVAAGLPPADPADLEPVLPGENSAQPPAAEAPAPEQPAPPPAVEEPPAQPPAAEPTPPPPEPAPAVEEQPAPAEIAPVEPAPQEQPAPAEEPAPAPAEQPALQPTPPPEQPQPPAAEQPVTPPVVEQPATPPAAEQPMKPAKPRNNPPAKPAPTEQPPAQPPAAEQPVQPAAPVDQPPAPATPAGPEPVVTLPPPVVDQPPPPPPPAATEATPGKFDLNKFKDRPKFGAQTPAAAASEPPPAALPKSEDAVKEGAVIPAQDGRVIVKEAGQVTVKHDDTGRFVRQGDQFQTRPSDNNTETTIITRPDGTQIVTVRDRNGDIIQRYRKNPNGSVQVLIGDMEQPGFFGRIIGKGPQLAPPRPRKGPPVVNLQIGPVQLTIPQQDYIVESSRVNEQQIQQTLLAPPVERVERTYSLEEIRQNGRIRDKVRRIDFDTITFDTGQATVADDQIIKMQGVGEAIRNIIQRDPTQVFLIEGHTDAVGSDLSNLALSDRRAETVAEILAYYYGVPPENLVTQGYGEQFLKIPTTGAERQNRRVAFRNITDLLQARASAQ